MFHTCRRINVHAGCAKLELYVRSICSFPTRALRFAARRGWIVAGMCVASGAFAGESPILANHRLIDRAEYATRLVSFWRGTCIANWTGLRSEGARIEPPFLTDADWGTNPFPDRPWLPLDFYFWGNPWNADDDTDIEYVYLHLCSTLNPPGVLLTPERIAAGWSAHINRSIWVSNATARELMSRGIVPPMTAVAQGLAHGVARTSDDSLMIDAQLTTEVFGLLAPGMPERALALADLPIRTTAAGHAVHASQFYVVLFSLAPVIDRSMPAEAQTEWLVNSARAFIPDSSKAAGVVDFVLAEYRANPDKTDWEQTRDRIYERYQRDAAANGWVYRAWTESSINFACGVMSLLYGDLDYRRTLRIATSAGWDADNQAATVAGLVAFLRSPEFDADLGWTAGTFRWSSTRDGLIDYLPGDVNAEDSFALMSGRMMPLIEGEIRAAGGVTDSARWLLPPGVPLLRPDALTFSPTEQLMRRSANRSVRDSGGSVTVTTNIPGAPSAGFGSGDPAFVADGVEHDFRGLEQPAGRGAAAPGYFSTQRTPPSVEPVHQLSVTYDRPVWASSIRLIEGDRFAVPMDALSGGGCPNPTFQVRINGAWVPAPIDAAALPPALSTPFAILDFPLTGSFEITGVRAVCLPVAPATFCTILELDALAPTTTPLPTTFDVNSDGRVDLEDLYAQSELPRDLTGDGARDDRDVRFMGDALRFSECRDMSQGRR